MDDDDLERYLVTMRDNDESINEQMAALIASRKNIRVNLVKVRGNNEIVCQLPPGVSQEDGARVVWLTCTDVHYQPLFQRPQR